MTLTVGTWASIDRIEFHKTAVVLGACGCAHGGLPDIPPAISPSTEILHSIFPTTIQDGCWLPAVLDDFALVASGPGKTPDVVAASMDREGPTSRTFTLRLARNRPTLEERLVVARNVWHYANNKKVPNVDRLKLMMDVVLRHCSKRVNKSFKSLKTLLDTYVKGDSLVSPNLLGAAGAALLNRCLEVNLGWLMDQCHDLEGEATVLNEDLLTSWIALLRALYDVQRALSFEEKGLKEAEPISQLAKLYRASISILKLAEQFKMYGFKLQIDALYIEDCSLPSWNALRNQAKALQGQATSIGHSSANVKEWLAQEPSYRQHAEISLLIYYEEHPELEPIVQYIGCSKKPCLLCDSFIRLQGKWAMRKSHCRFYPLWTVKKRVQIQNGEQGFLLRNVMKRLVARVQQHYLSLQTLPSNRTKLAPQAESLAQWTRDSLATGSLLSRSASPCPSLDEADFEEIRARSGRSKRTTLLWKRLDPDPAKIKSCAVPIQSLECGAGLFTDHVRHRLRWHIPRAKALDWVPVPSREGPTPFA